MIRENIKKRNICEIDTAREKAQPGGIDETSNTISEPMPLNRAESATLILYTGALSASVHPRAAICTPQAQNAEKGPEPVPTANKSCWLCIKLHEKGYLPLLKTQTVAVIAFNSVGVESGIARICWAVLLRR